MKKALIIILHILGFPALLGYLTYKSIDMIKGGLSYGVFVFVGLIVTLLFALIYFLVIGIMAKKAKKKNKKNIYRQTFVAMILSFCLLGGLWIGLDLGIPNFLKDATSSTIFYEDLADNYYARSVVNKELLNEYIKRNVENGNLSSATLEEYQKQGVKNEEVANLIKVHFASIDKDGYATFKGPNIDFALSDRMTIAVLVHLLLDTRKISDQEYHLYDAKTKDVVTDPVEWNILDMLGEPMDIADIELLGDEGYKDFLNSLPAAAKGVLQLAAPNGEAFRKFITNTVNGENLKGVLPRMTEGITGSPIFIGIDGVTIQLVPSNQSRGVLDYQSMGWLNSNGLVYAIVMLFSTRKLFLIWAAVLVVTNFLIGMLRGMGAELKEKEEQMQKEAQPATNPYMRAGYGAYPGVTYGSVAYPPSSGYSAAVRRYDMSNFR
ncbi:MAG: hypothetical protein GX242_05490 [Clostridiales bacterium]|nr:hypothetical protein [Clostridiales bacterium]